MNRPPLLPSDHYLMHTLAEAGVELTEEDWREFKAEVRRRAAAGPQPSIVAGAETLAIISLVFTAISIGLTIVASFFKPKQGRAAQLEANQLTPNNLANIRRYAPRYGFDAVQDPAAIGTTIPLVYALRETVNGQTVGGLRVNMPLLWSQIKSYGGSQLLRAIFLVSEGPIAELDKSNFAIGNNSITSYDLQSTGGNDVGSRITVYFAPNGGRLRSSNRLIGRTANLDDGNSERDGAPDVFSIRSQGSYRGDFSAATKPSTQTAFGITAFIGSNFGYRLNPTLRPRVVADLVPEGNDGGARVRCRVDNAAQVAYLKSRVIFGCRSGLISGSVSSVGSTVTFTLDRSSEIEEKFFYPRNDDQSSVEGCGDVASTVTSRQKSWDDSMVIGDLYKIGSALAICSRRTPEDSVFLSDSDYIPGSPGQGQTINVEFTTVRGASVPNLLTTIDILRRSGTNSNQPTRNTATSAPHVYKIALANITTTRPCRVLEVGIRSILGIRIAGLCNFKDALTYNQINGKACNYFNNNFIAKGETLKTDIFQSGTISTSEERYSFFRISFREAGSTGAFTDLAPCFGIRGISQQNVFNSIRFVMPKTTRWEFRFEPLSGWEIRSGAAGGALEVIDSRLKTDRTVVSNNVTINYRGVSVARTQSTFAINSVIRRGGEEIGINYTDDDSYLDAWGKLAEDFVYEEATTSISGSPEHEIVYVNEIVENTTLPLYNNLAIVGLNVRSSIEFQQFSQFSAYVTKGIECRQLLNGLAAGPTHLFPDILLDLLTNKRYGRGDLIPDELIDLERFKASAEWCKARGYFFDGALTNRQNLRQWAADVAATHLLTFGESGGRFFLRPAITFGTVPVKALFTAGNIREKSFRFQYLDAEERRPIQVSIRWREERLNSDPTNSGLFPVEREILVREVGTADTIPVESIDVSDYCTSRRHAIDIAKYVVRARRLSTSAIRFETTYEGVTTGLAPANYIKVALDYNVYDEFNNGVILPDGSLVGTQALTDGSYNAILWNGKQASLPYEGTITVSNNGTIATPTGVVFTIRKPGREVRTYQVESIEPTEDGYFAIEAIHTPTTTAGTLVLADGFDNDANWIIQD